MIGDSRCCALRRPLTRGGTLCYAYRGAGLATIRVRATALIEQHCPKVCIILAGINDATLLDRRSRTITPLFDDAFTLSNHIIRLILRTRKLLLDRFPGLKVMFGGIIGADLARYNEDDQSAIYQSVLDDTIMQVNAYIRLLNQLTDLPQPRLTSKVHGWRRGRRVNRYHLLYDGLHLGPLVRQTWLREILKCAELYSRRT